jgi:FG-GAP-like repeat
LPRSLQAPARFTPVSPILPSFANFTAADFNGDGIPDLIGLVPAATINAGAAYGPLSIRLGNGDGTFSADDIVMGVDFVYTLADLNQDGAPDILAGDSNGIVVPVFTAQSGNTVAAPLDLTQPGNVYLSLFGTGFDATMAPLLSVSVQGMLLKVTYAGPQGSIPGLIKSTCSFRPLLPVLALRQLSQPPMASHRTPSRF